MLTIEKSRVIDAPVEAVFAYVVDPTHLPEYHPGIAEVKNVECLPNGGYRYTTVDKVLGLRIEATWEDTEVVPNERGVRTLQNALMDCTAYARFERLPGGKTRASNVADVSFHGGPLGRLAEMLSARFMDQGAQKALEAAKARMEAGVEAKALASSSS